MGSGDFGMAYKVKYQGNEYAAKEMVRVEEKQKFIDLFLEQCRLCSNLNHPNIVQFEGVFINPQLCPVMIMELMDESLTTYVKRPSSDNTKLSLLIDVSTGLEYLHAKSPPIVHGDLSPNNILLTFTGDGCTLPIAKITDLGFARLKYEHSNKPRSVFLPPEALREKPVYDTPLDVFSFASVVLFLTTQEWPTPVDLEIGSEVERRQKYLDMMTSSLTNLKALVEVCLNNDPACRPSAAVVLEKIQVCCLFYLR